MSTHITTTLAYVRTSAGVVKVDPGERVPDALVDGELDRLDRAGVITALQSPAPAPKTPAKVKGGQGS